MLSLPSLVIITFLLSFFISYFLEASGEIIYLSFAFVFLVLAFHTFHMGLYLPYEVEKPVLVSESNHEVISLSDTSYMKNYSKSSFILGTGSSVELNEQQNTYNSLVGNTKEGYKTETFDAKTTTLHFDENERPFVLRKTYETKTEKKKDWYNGGLMKYKSFGSSTKNESFELHLPENTVQVEYEIDLN